MAATKVSGQPTATAATTDDYLLIVNDPGGSPTTQKITVGNFSARPTFLATALTSTSWDGDAFSTTAKTLIDLSAVFSVPAGVKAVLVRASVQDSGAGASDCMLILGPTDTANLGMVFNCFPSNDRWNRVSAIVPCDANGDIYYQTIASGASTLDIDMRIHGYWL